MYLSLEDVGFVEKDIGLWKNSESVQTWTRCEKSHTSSGDGDVAFGGGGR